MRPYPVNSPQAAARIVALATLADGSMCRAEFDVLKRLGAHEQLGMAQDAFDAVVHTLCEDLLTPAHSIWADKCRVDFRALAELMAEIDQPELRLKVLRLCIAVIEADSHVVEGESLMLAAAVEHWGLHREMLQPAKRGVEHV